MTQPLYATAINLRDSTSNVELAQVATPAGQTIVDPVQFGAYIDANGAGATGTFLIAYNNLIDALTRSSSLMDTRLRSRYNLPLITPYPDVMRDYCVTLARFDLNRNRTTDEMRLRYDNVMKDLNNVASGLLDVGAVDTNNVGESSAGAGIGISASVRDNTYSTLGNFQSQLPGYANCR